ncbi:MAG: hypothetical protein WCA46_23770 [Actinocatenispora sp.]
MSAISFEELTQLAGELLPERAVLSTITPLGAPEHGGPNVAIVGGGDDHAPTVSSACQAVANDGLATLAPTSSLTCTPAAIAG